jgi:hypothetical protein
MIIETPIFEDGTYNKPCLLFKNIMIGSVHCTGHKKIGIKKCKFCVEYKENNIYFFKILKESTPIVSEVICNRPQTQLKLF